MININVRMIDFIKIFLLIVFFLVPIWMRRGIERGRISPAPQSSASQRSDTRATPEVSLSSRPTREIKTGRPRIIKW